MSLRDLDAAGLPDADELRECDELLDRLGRRVPRPDDLEDPLVVALAVLADEVDHLPVPASASRQALTAAGAWPPLQGDRPAPTWASRQRHHTDRQRHHTDNARRVRVLGRRPAAGLAAAAALILVGGLIGVRGNAPAPEGGGVRTIEGSDGGGAHQVTLTTMLQLVAVARSALHGGDPSTARTILDRVAGQLPRLPPGDRQVVAGRLSAARKELPGDGGSPRARSSRSGAPVQDGTGGATSASPPDGSSSPPDGSSPREAPGAAPGSPGDPAPSPTW
ncbi:MAG TPA: hypothetical protein VI248_20490, partial [Kineosporiaceae bacterium]